ncbi:MAG: DUF1573 domain-containing protein [Bacteroidales bacterium]|nr:DUF1573 domain-containing protein [Bacteroidales bacterium]
MRHLISLKISLSFLVAVLLMSCNRGKESEIDADFVKIPVTADGKDEKIAMPEITFENRTHDFGKLLRGEKVTFAYKFTNTGNAALVISAVLPSCGCTVADFTKTPVMPGESGYVTVSFNSETKKGMVSSGVTVQANTYPSDTKLTFEAMVAEL